MKMFSGNGRDKSEKKEIKREAPNRNLNKPEKPKKSPGKRAAKVLLIILIILAVLAVSAALYWKLTTKPPELTNDPAKNSSPVTDLESEEPIDNLSRYYTLMVAGVDQEGFNTDTIMVMRFDTQELTASVVSIPRDIALNITENVKKINGVYYSQQAGGIERLMDEFERIAGFRPNNYVLADMEAFEQVIDAIGGVWFDVPQDLNYTHWNEVTGEPFYINVRKGYQCLNGYDALGVWRYRAGLKGGDLERISIQHKLLYAIAEQVMNLGLSDLPKLLSVAKIASEYCTTDLTLGNIQWYAKEFLKMDTANLNILTAPVTGCFIHKVAYVTLNVDEWIAMINEYLNPNPTEITKEDVEILYLAVPKSLVNGFLYIEPNELATTNGAKVHTNFLYN